MKAIRVHEFGGPEVMRIEDVPDPKPDAGQVVVKIHAAGVNPVDTYIRSGTYAIKPNRPYTPGSDGAGVVEIVGKDVKSVAAGDRVYIGGSISGCYAEKALCSESSVYKLPAHVSFSGGAAIHVPYATAYRALFQRANAKPGETVLVHGASGGVGIASVQLARAAGLRVIGTAGTARGIKLALDEGAHEVVDHTASDHFEKLLALTGGRGFDVIIEMLANVNLARDLTLLALLGRVVTVGNRGTIEINPRDSMGRDGAILGMSLAVVQPRDIASAHAAIQAGLENKSLRPVVGREFPLAEAIQAQLAVMEKGAYGKIVLIP